LSKSFPGQLLCFDIVPDVIIDGGKRVNSIEELSSSDVIITMLPATKHVESILNGPKGVFATLRKGSIVIDCSTIDPIASKKLAQTAFSIGINMLDAPVCFVSN